MTLPVVTAEVANPIEAQVELIIREWPQGVGSV
jgi:hypothetical protein